MNGESKKHSYLAKALSNHVYAVFMGTVHSRCTTTEKANTALQTWVHFLLLLDRLLQGVWLPPLSSFSILISVSFWSFMSTIRRPFLYHLPGQLIMLSLLQPASLPRTSVITKSRAEGQQLLWGWDSSTTALDNSCCSVKTKDWAICTHCLPSHEPRGPGELLCPCCTHHDSDIIDRVSLHNNSLDVFCSLSRCWGFVNVFFHPDSPGYIICKLNIPDCHTN